MGGICQATRRRAIQNKKKQILSEREDFSQDGPCLMTGYLGFEVRIRKKSKQDRKRSLLLFWVYAKDIVIECENL